MLYGLGRFLQFLGLIILPVAIAGNVMKPQDVTLWRMLGMASAGILCFVVGYMFQQQGRP